MEGNSPNSKTGSKGLGSTHLGAACLDLELTEDEAAQLLAEAEAELKTPKEHSGPKQLTLPFTEWEWFS